MPFPSESFVGTFTDKVHVVGDELRAYYAQLTGWLGGEHNERGGHTDVTALSIAVAGNGSFDGTVTADADGTPVQIGAIGPTNEPALRLTNSADADWMLYAVVPRSLSLRDVLEVADAAMLDVVRTGASAYDLRPHGSAITLTLGSDVSGQRWAEVNALIVRARMAQLTGRITPATMTADQNDYAIGAGLSRVYLSANAPHNITGIVAGASGQLLWLVNNGGFDITLKVNSGSSASGNRIACANGADVVLRQSNGSALLHYDATLAFWFVLGA